MQNDNFTQPASQSTSWPRTWDDAPSVITPAKARRLIKMAGARNAQMLQSLADERKAHGVHSARRMARRYLLSFTARLAAVVDAWCARKTTNPFATEAAVEVVKTAQTLSAWAKLPERATYRMKLKSNGEDTRRIHALTFRQVAVDKLAERAGRAISDLLPTQFNRKGGGIKKLEAWLVARLPTTQKIMTVDIPSCFDFVDRNSVEISLLIPQQVVEAALFHLMDNAKALPSVLMGISPKDTHAVGTSSAKRRVPQGSALAQLASDIEVDKVLRSVAAVHPSVHVAAHGDNLIFLLEDAGRAGSVLDALTSIVTKQFGPDATTALVHRIRNDTPAHFEFCKRIYGWKKGHLTKRLPEGYIDEFETKSMVAMQDAFASKSLNRLESCEESIKGFVSAHVGVKRSLEACVALLVSLEEYRRILAKKTLQGPD